MKDLDYARCKACDTRFYPQWREDREAFEDLCPVCLGAALSDEDDDSDSDLDAFTDSIDWGQHDNEWD